MARLSLTKRYGYLEAPNEFQTLMALGDTIPVRHKWNGRMLIFDPSRAAFDAVMAVFPDVEISDPEGILDHFRNLERIEKLPKIAKPLDYAYSDTAPKPRDYQSEVLNFSAQREVCAIILPTGGGKSRIEIDNAAYLFEQEMITQMLIVAPNGVHRQWIEEQFPVWWPARLPLEAIRFTKTYKPRKFWPATRGEGLRVLAINVESLSRGSGEKYAAAFLRQESTLMVVDEPSRIKTPGAGRSLAAARLRPLAAYRRTVGGRPITKGPEDLYAQYRFLDPAITGFNTAVAYRSRYCVYGGHRTSDADGVYHDRQIVAYQNLDELSSKIAPHTVLIPRERMNIPLPVFVERPVPLTDIQRKHYKSFVETLMAELESGKVSDAPHAAVRLIRFQQILSGYLPVDDSCDPGGVPIIERFPTHRISVLKEALDEIDGKVVIWARFREEVIMIKEALKDKCVTYYGADDSEQRIKNKRRFLSDPDCIYFIATQAVGGIGLDGLQRVSQTAIFYSNDFDADHRWQAEGRLPREGGLGLVTNIDLVARGTIDRTILGSFADKEYIANQILKNPRMLLLQEDD